MPKWARGEAEVEQLLARGELERVTGAAADATPLLEQARKTAATAAGLVSSDAYSACVLAYDAARFACIALLAQQGLRATTSGGHYAVEQAVRAQFGDGFRPFGTLRRRRNELEYPHLPSDAATPEEAEQAAGTAQRIITAADTLLPQVSFFSQDQELQTTGPQEMLHGIVPICCSPSPNRLSP
jgi:HEPN domain-containing protein